MDVRDYQERQREQMPKLVYLFNPTDRDFNVTLAFEEGFKSFAVPQMVETKLPFWAAEMIAKKIVDYMVHKKDRYVSDGDRQKMFAQVKLYDPAAVS